MEIVEALYQLVELAIPYYGDRYDAVLAALIVLQNVDPYDVVQTCYLSSYRVFVSCCFILFSYTLYRWSGFCCTGVALRRLRSCVVVVAAECAPELTHDFCRAVTVTGALLSGVEFVK